MTPYSPAARLRLPINPRVRAWVVAAGLWILNIPILLAPALVGEGVTPGALITVGIFLVFGFALCVALYEWLERWSRRGTGRYIAAAVGGVVVCALAIGFIDGVGGVILAKLGLTTPRPMSYVAIRAVTNTIFLGWMFAIFAAATVLIEFSNRLREREQQLVMAEGRTAQARAAETAARLAALRYQLNPHFLFNTLNAISSAVVTQRTAEAETMLTRLASFLRVTLETSPKAMVSLEDELGTVEAYLEIEAERFRDRLTARIDCPVTLRDAPVPGFILQPLVENAIKHGLSRSTGPVTVRVSAERDGEALRLTVSDDARPLSGAPAATSGGIGLAAIRERLEVLYGAAGGLTVKPLQPGYQATITLPLSAVAALEEPA